MIEDTNNMKNNSEYRKRTIKKVLKCKRIVEDIWQCGVKNNTKISIKVPKNIVKELREIADEENVSVEVLATQIFKRGLDEREMLEKLKTDIINGTIKKIENESELTTLIKISQKLKKIKKMWFND